MNCIIDNPQKYGIGYAGEYATIKDNVICNSNSSTIGGGIYIDGTNGALQAIIHGNKIYGINTTASGTFIGIQIQGVDGYIVESNIIKDINAAGGIGGFLCSGANGNISNNRAMVFNTSAMANVFGIVSTGSHLICGGNTIANINNTYAATFTAYVKGIGIWNEDASVLGNRIYNVSAVASNIALGIDVVLTASGITVVSNSIRSISYCGIQIGGDDCTIQGNAVFTCGIGIYIQSTADRVVVAGNRSSRNVVSNFMVSGTNTTDSGNDWT
jgi:hypothetical protein